MRTDPTFTKCRRLRSNWHISLAPFLTLTLVLLLVMPSFPALPDHYYCPGHKCLLSCSAVCNCNSIRLSVFLL